MLRARHFLIPWLIFGTIKAQNVVQTAAGFEHPDPLQNLFQHHHQFQQQQLALGLPQHQLPPHPMLQHPLSAGAIPTLPPHHFMSHPFFFNHPAFLQHQLVAAAAAPTLMATTTERANIPPQAVKPSIQSDVKAFTEKNRPIDRSVEKLQTVSAEVRSPLAYSPTKELRKVEIVPVEHVLETLVTTTQTIILTTTTTQTAPTTTTLEPRTTNLPQKIEEDRQKAEKNGETLDLIKHLNSSDLENFLQSANLTTKEAQRFLKLVEKVLEEELSKRLHNKTLDGDTIDNHEVKTVDTHLKFDEADLPTVSPSATSAPKPSTTTGTPVIVAALSQRSGPGEKLTGSTVAIHSLEDVRKREQEEFDRLLGQIVLETKDDNDENEDDDLLLSANGEKPAVTPRNNFRPTTRHPPKTEFEHLVEDYRYRLSSSNGFNDLIKALRNAHIGFFDRSPVKRRPIGK